MTTSDFRRYNGRHQTFNVDEAVAVAPADQFASLVKVRDTSRRLIETDPQFAVYHRKAAERAQEQIAALEAELKRDLVWLDSPEPDMELLAAGLALQEAIEASVAAVFDPDNVDVIAELEGEWLAGLDGSDTSMSAQLRDAGFGLDGRL